MILLRWGPCSDCSISLITTSLSTDEPKIPTAPPCPRTGHSSCPRRCPHSQVLLQKKTVPMTNGRRRNPTKPPKPTKKSTQSNGWKHKNQVLVLTVHRHCDYINNEQQEHKWTLWEKKPLTFFHCSKVQTTKNSLTQIPSISSHTRAVIVGFNTQVQQEQ